MGLDSSSLGDSSVPAGDRVRAAGLKMDGSFDQLIQGKARLRPLPSALARAAALAVSRPIYDAGVSRALELAQANKPAGDSTKAPGAMRPAPGGPPIPGAAPTTPPPPSASAPEMPRARPKASDSAAGKPQ